MTRIENSTVHDIDEIFRLYKIATDYQKAKLAKVISPDIVVVWPAFERKLVEKEIAESRQWKLIIDNEVACVWATTLSDEQIWEERNKDTAVYIHRIATNPNFRGQNFVGVIVDWARSYVKNNELDYIRLDTVGNNKKLIELYTGAGFSFLGLFDLKNTSGLPLHYNNNMPVSLFEIKV